MGWGSGAHDSEGRPIGYNVKARCDHPGCNAPIHRGMAHVCGDVHGGGDHGCGRYFCADHLSIGNGTGEQLCPECLERWELEHGENEDD